MELSCTSFLSQGPPPPIVLSVIEHYHTSLISVLAALKFDSE